MPNRRMLRSRAIAGVCGLAAPAAGHYLALDLTTCFRASPGILVWATCPWQPRAAGFVLLTVLTAGIPFLLGLRRGGWWTCVLPPMGYFLALAWWQMTRGQRLGYDLAYDTSLVEFLVLRVAVYWGFDVCRIHGGACVGALAPCRLKNELALTHLRQRKGGLADPRGGTAGDEPLPYGDRVYR